MNFWEFLDRHWPSERGWIIILLASLVVGLLVMAIIDPTLWQVELFKTLLTAAVITGFLNMVLPFHFTANKSDETKAENTGKMADAMKEQAITARSSNEPSVAASHAADAVVEAAQQEADNIKKDQV